MSSNSTAASPAGADTPCCKATMLVAAAAATFLFCFVLVVAFLFVRFLQRRRRWRRSAVLLHLQQLPPKLGLVAAAIALIPSFPYRGATGAAAAAAAAACSSSSGPAAECAVCLNILGEGQQVRELPGCKHVFHRECIDVWLASRASCPVCRGNAAPPPTRAGEEGAAAAAASASSARVVAIEVFDDAAVLSSSSTPGEAGTVQWTWTRPEAGSALA